jgi:hypothetical protein
MLGLGRLVLDTVVVVGAFVIATVIAMGYDDRIKEHFGGVLPSSGPPVLAWLRLEWLAFLASLEVYRRTFDRAVSIGGVSGKAMVVGVLAGLLIQFPIAYALAWVYWEVAPMTDWWLLPLGAQFVLALVMSTIWDAYCRYLPDPEADIPIATKEDISRSL